MKLKNIMNMAIIGCLSLTVTSCSDYLDVSKEMNENLTEAKVWENPTYTRNWYGNIYLCMSEFSETGSECGAFSNPWSNMSGEIASQMAPSKDAMVSGYTAGSAQFHRWATLYKYIRQAMIFIRDAKDEGVGSDQNVLTPEDIARMKDEARYLMAYSYFSLFELYGPFCIVENIDDPAYPTYNDYKRATVDECVKFIDDILADILSRNNLPETVITNKGEKATADAFNLNEVVRPTKITARALRAKLWVYAASPLFNGGWDKAMELKDADGTQLFPSKDPHKWVIAKQHLEELLEACEEDGHGLYEYQVNGTNNPEMSVYRLFQDFNREILWCSTNNSYSDQYKMEKRTNPRDVNGCYGTVGPTQEAVDMFFTKDGLTIDEDPNYHEDALVQVTNTAYDDAGKETHNDPYVFNMYSNREPRFYQDVIYQGKSWFNIFQNKSGNANYQVDFSLHGGAGPDSRDTPLSGYMLGKFKNRKVNHASGDTQKYSRVSIIYRLAEFYLFYAETLNEMDPSNPKIIEYIDKVRERAGIPTYTKLAEEGIKDIRGNYEKQKEAIQRERYVELYCEGQWYFDIRRWMICGKGQLADQTRFSGMNEYGTTGVTIGQQGSYYRRTKLENRQWDDKMYLYPIHQNVVQLGAGKIVQNPGW